MIPFRSSASPWTRRLAAAAALALCILSSPPATAQEATSLIGNLAEAQECFVIGVPEAGTPDAAAHFRTGDKALAITSVGIHWQTNAGGAANRVGIFTHDAGNRQPGPTQVGGWLVRDSGLGVGLIHFVGERGERIALHADTDYWVVVDIGDGSRPTCTTSGDFVVHPQAGGARMLHTLRGGDADTAQWPRLQADRTLVYELSGIVGAGPDPGNPGAGPQAVPATSPWSLLSLAGLLLAGVLGRSASRGRTP